MVISIETFVKECSTYSSFLIKDYGTFEKQYYFKSAIKKSGFEENESTNKSDFEKYVDLNELSNDRTCFIETCKDLRYIDENNQERAMRRAKNKIFDLCFLNDWDYFITLTFDNEKVGCRYDLDTLKKKTLETFHQWQKKYGVKYLLVPELHKDGALHFHGFIQDCNKRLKMTTTNKYTNQGNEIFNINSWANYKGFNTACLLDKSDISKQKTSSYISKYITKQDKIFDKYYYCSNGLIDSPKVTYYDNVPIEFFEGDVYENAQCYIKIVQKKEIKKDD